MGSRGIVIMPYGNTLFLLHQHITPESQRDLVISPVLPSGPDSVGNLQADALDPQYWTGVLQLLSLNIQVSLTLVLLSRVLGAGLQEAGRLA